MEQQPDKKPDPIPNGINFQFFTPQLRPKTNEHLNENSMTPYLLMTKSISTDFCGHRIMSPRQHSLSINSAPMFRAIKKRQKKPVHEQSLKINYRNSIKASIFPKVFSSL